jgi:hypothetical protein
MKPAAFEYVAAHSLEEALAALQDGGEDAKPIAGGQSLVPALNMRLVRPTLLVDLNRAGLDTIEANGVVRVGATVRQAALEYDPRMMPASEKRGMRRGIGMAMHCQRAGQASERMEIRVDPNGSVALYVGTFSTGQGHETMFAQMVSDWLHVPMAHVRVLQGDTDRVLFGRGTLRCIDYLTGECVQIDRGRFRNPSTGFDAREIQQIVDDALHSLRVCANCRSELAAIGFGDIFVGERFGKSADDSERSSQLVRNVGNEITTDELELTDACEVEQR